jgi:hypothetical protein
MFVEHVDCSGMVLMAGSVLDADGGWTFQEGTFEKAKLCKDNGVDVRLDRGAS